MLKIYTMHNGDPYENEVKWNEVMIGLIVHKKTQTLSLLSRVTNKTYIYKMRHPVQWKK